MSFPRRRGTMMRIAAAATCSLFVLSACTVEDAATGDNAVKIALPFQPVASLSPYSDDALLNTRMGIGEALLQLDANGEPQPELAKSWEVIDDKTVEFTLRDNVKFHDGTDLTPEAVVGALEHAVKADSRPKGLGKSELTFTAEGDNKVKVVSADPDPILAQRFADSGAIILAEKAYEGATPSLVGTGTGPFKLVELTDSEAKTEGFADYWDGKPALDAVTTVFIEDGAGRANAVRAGEVSLAQAVPIAQLAELGDLTVESTPIPRAVLLHLNTKTGAFADAGLRAKAAEAVKPESVVDNIYEGHASLAGGSLFSESADWAKSVESKNSLAGTKDAAGTKIRLATWTERPELPEAASVLAEQLRGVGFDVEVVAQDYDSLEPALLNGEFDAVLASRNYQTGAADPVSYLSSDFSCEGSYNLSLYCNPEIDAAIEETSKISETTKRYTSAAEIGAKVVADNAVIPVAHEYSLITYNKLDGVSFDPFERKLITKDTKISK